MNFAKLAQKFGGVDGMLAKESIAYIQAKKVVGQDVPPEVYEQLAKLKFDDHKVCAHAVWAVVMAFALSPNPQLLKTKKISMMAGTGKFADDILLVEDIIIQIVKLAKEICADENIAIKILNDMKVKLMIEYLSNNHVTKHFMNIAAAAFSELSQKASIDKQIANPWAEAGFTKRIKIETEVNVGDTQTPTTQNDDVVKIDL